jgi:hypothetical protein
MQKMKFSLILLMFSIFIIGKAQAGIWGVPVPSKTSEIFPLAYYYHSYFHDQLFAMVLKSKFAIIKTSTWSTAIPF